MAKDPKREYVRIYDHIWADNDIRKLSDSAALAYIYLTAWSKATRNDGRFNQLGADHCGVTPEDLGELEGRFIECIADGWQILKWDEWQMTEAERGQERSANRLNGAKGGEARRDNRMAAQAGVGAGGAGGAPEEVQARLKNLHGIWAEKRPTKDGGPMRERFDTFMAIWNERKVDIEEFEKRVIWRLDEFDASYEENKRDFLGTIGNFLKSGRWSDQLSPAVPDIVSEKEMLPREA